MSEGRRFKAMADYLWSEFEKRKKNRHDLEKHWDEVDRQVRMEPAPKASSIPEWVPEIELPMQADALEVLCADADRLQFPDSYDWFKVNAQTSPEYFRRLANDLALPEDVEPRTFSQEDVNAVTEAALIHAHKQYDLKGCVGQLNAEAFTYGTYAGRVRQVQRKVFTNDYRGVTSSSEDLPILVPMSIKNVYLDDKPTKALNQGTMIGPVQMYCYEQKVQDLQAASKSGSGGVKSITGGWRKQTVSRLKGDSNDMVKIVECEGDIIVPNSRDTTFLPNVIVTVACDAEGPKVIRYRENQLPFQPLISGTYYKDRIGVYGTSPLMKGYSVQKAATELAVDMLSVSKLQALPPISWNAHDSRLRSTGGPKVEPRALWDTFTEPKPHSIGNLDQTFAAYASLLKQYEEVTGVSPVRAGGQTKSHQSATAVTIEDNRGQTRTVSYVRSNARGFLTNFLNMELFILRKSMKKQSVYIPRYQGYVDIGKDSIPDNATFNVVGAAGPFEKRQEEENKIAALGALVQMEQLIIQLQQNGRTDLKSLDLNKVREDMVGVVIPDASVPEYFLDVQQ